MLSHRPDRRVERREPHRHRACRAVVLAFGCVVAATGCNVLQRTTTSAVTNPGMSLFAAFHPSEADRPGIDLALLKREASESSGNGPEIGPGDLLEITVHDLYEPGRPHTFPCRVDDRLQVDLPLIGTVPLTERTCAAIERRISSEYRNRELLKNPTVVVRDTEQAVVAVTVTGAVVMPGTVRMLRSDASVFSAIAQCGGGRANAGKQISVTRNMSATNAPKSAPDGTGTGDVAERAVIRGQSPADAAPAAPVQPSAPVQTPASAVPAITTTASPTAVADAKPVESAPPPNTESPPDIANQALTDSPPTDSSLADRGGNGRDAVATPRVEWFHLDRDEDVAALKKLNLEDGDILHITETALPVRVMGHVTRSGPVQVPGDRRLSVWDVVEQAGGIRTNAWPVGVTLYRPTSETGRASQFSWTLESAESARPPTEFLRPGDVVYVAPSAGARLKNAVGGLLRK